MSPCNNFHAMQLDSLFDTVAGSVADSVAILTQLDRQLVAAAAAGGSTQTANSAAVLASAAQVGYRRTGEGTAGGLPLAQALRSHVRHGVCGLASGVRESYCWLHA